MEKATTNLVGAAYWRDRADSIQLEGRCLIDGKLVEAQSGHTFDCVSERLQERQFISMMAN